MWIHDFCWVVLLVLQAPLQLIVFLLCLVPGPWPCGARLNNVFGSQTQNISRQFARGPLAFALGKCCYVAWDDCLFGMDILTLVRSIDIICVLLCCCVLVILVLCMLDCLKMPSV